MLACAESSAGMMQTGTVRVLDREPDPASAELETPSIESTYEDATEMMVAEYDYPIPGFVNAILEEIAPEKDMAGARLVDELHESPDVEEAYLLVFPDETLMFLGSDPTAKDAVPWFTFTVGPAEPVPAPVTCDQALDLLKPPEVQDLYHDEQFLPGRHGEWWLIPANLIPSGTVFSPGVASKPYGPSPLGNHVPREYAFTVSDADFMDAFHDHADAPSSIETPPEALRWTHRHLQKVNPGRTVPDWAAIRDFAGDVLVRGTIRHRDDDHFVENLGETWHKAKTHNIEVYTADALGNVHLDYYGR